MVVEADGTVGDVKVIDSGGPFEAAAVDAVRTYRFTPASRAGKPLRARIRAVVAFSPPQDTHAPAVDDGSPAAAGDGGNPGASPEAAPAAREEIEEVRVSGRRETQSPTEHRLGRAEVRVLPGAFGDPFRAIDVLPGVVPIVSGLPYFYIRGAPPSAVGYYIDEVRVPYLFHFGLGPGVVQPALLEEVSLHPAAFPARFGRFAGGIVAGQTRDPDGALLGEAQIRLYDAGAYVETPFANGRATVGIGGRYSYTAGLLSLFVPGLTIDYRDYNARASYQLDERWRASILTFGSFDYASQVEDGVEQVFFASEFHRVDMRFDRRGADGSTSRVAATLGFDRSRLEGSRFAQSILTGVRGRHGWPLGPKLDVEIGVDLQAENYTGDLPNRYAVRPRDYEQAVTLFAPRVETVSGAWASAVYRPYPGWEITGTLRGDAFTSAGKSALGPSPRVSARIPVARKVAFLAAMGIAPQAPAFAIPVPAVGYRGLPGGLAFAYQKSAGAELQLPLRFSLRAVGFHHSYFNLRDFSRNGESMDLNDTQIAASSPTQAYGLETFLSRKLSERFSAFSSFTLARAEIGATLTEPRSVSPFDRTYVFQIGGVADLGRGWRASTRLLTYGGWPKQSADGLTGGGRLPAFYRIEARLEKRWTLQKERWISLVLEGLNVTGSKDVIGTRCEEGVGCSNQSIGPIIVPSLGVEAGL